MRDVSSRPGSDHVSDCRAAVRKIGEFGILQIALDDIMDREVPLVESECRLEWLRFARLWQAKCTQLYSLSSSAALEKEEFGPSIRVNVMGPPAT